MSATPTTASPIADLSYRNYDGPLESPELRWWVIAKRIIFNAIKLKSLWVMILLSGGYYIIELIILFFLQQLRDSSPGAQEAFKRIFTTTVWKDQFVYGFSFGQTWFMVIALLVGAGAIANDNRANALLVYLSKPCSKLDYILGKWVGVFLIMVGAMAIPTLAFWAYGLLSFTSQGFIKQDPWVVLKMLGVIPLAAAFQTSLVLAVSSMFRQGRIAGATYAGLYFLPLFFTKLMQGMWMMSQGTANPMVKTLYYSSIDGIQIGLAKSFLRPEGTNLFAFPGKMQFYIGPPSLPLILFIIAVAIAGSLAVMWSRVRAVEVV